MQSTGLVVAAGGLAAANELLFAPLSGTGGFDVSQFNWRLIPATVILALIFGGLENLAPDFAKGLAGLTLLAVLVIPAGQTGSIVQNIVKITTPTH